MLHSLNERERHIQLAGAAGRQFFVAKHEDFMRLPVAFMDYTVHTGCRSRMTGTTDEPCHL
jgi:hypothetical protein